VFPSSVLMSKQTRTSNIKVKFLFFSSVSATSAASGVVFVNPNTSLTPHGALPADGFEFYKFNKLAFRLFRTGTINGLQSMTYVGGIEDTSQLTVGQSSESICTSILVATDTQPTRWQNVPKNLLRGYMPWYKTIQGSPDSAEEIQGQLVATTTSGSAESVFFEVRGEVEYRGPIATTSTPAERGRLESLKRAAQLAALLALLPSNATTPFCDAVGVKQPGSISMRKLPGSRP